jgi:hypothetical protein
MTSCFCKRERPGERERNYLIDLKAAIILNVEATRAIRQAEVGAARTMC